MASIVKFVRSCFSYDSHCMHLKDTRNIYRFFTLSFQICFARRMIVIRAIRRKSNNIDQTIPRFHFPRTWKSEWIASPCVTAELIGLVHDNPEAIAAGYRRRLSGGTRANRRRRRRRRPVTEHSAGVGRILFLSFFATVDGLLARFDLSRNRNRKARPMPITTRFETKGGSPSIHSFSFCNFLLARRLFLTYLFSF